MKNQINQELGEVEGSWSDFFFFFKSQCELNLKTEETVILGFPKIKDCVSEQSPSHKLYQMPFSPSTVTPEVWIHTCISFHLQPADLHHCNSLCTPWARKGEQEIPTTCSLGCWKRSKRVSPNGQTHTTFSMHRSILPFLLFNTQIICMLLLWPPIMFCTTKKTKDTGIAFIDVFSSLAEMAPTHFKQKQPLSYILLCPACDMV